MAQLFCLIRMAGSDPELDRAVTPFHGVVKCGTGDVNRQWAAYLVSGTGAELVAIDALPQVVGIVGVSKNGDVRWGELDGMIAPAKRTEISTWLAARGFPTIPAGWTYKQVVLAIYKRLSPDYKLDTTDVEE